MNHQFKSDADHMLSGYTWTRGDMNQVLAQIEGEKPVMKKKLTVSIALAMVLVLLATVAAFAIGLTNSKGYTNLQKARDAIIEKYDFDSELITLLLYKNPLEGDDQHHFEFCTSPSMFMNSDAFGVYTVDIDDKGNATATWSYDDVDPASWADGDLTSPVWGAPQLKGALERYQLYREWEQETALYTQPYEEYVRLHEEFEKVIAPIKFPYDYRRTSEENLAGLTPDPVYSIDEGTEEYVELAKRALLDQYGFTDDTLVLFDIDTVLMNDSWAVNFIPQARERAQMDIVDWRWASNLEERIGGYAVQMDANTKEIQSVSWTFDDVDLSGYDETNWGAAEAYSPQMVVWAMKLISDTKPIYDKYPTDQTDWFSIEDAAAYDEAFRKVGFTDRNHAHALPKDTDVTHEQALQIAIEAMKAEYKLTDDQIADSYEPRPEYLVIDGVGTWDVTFYSGERMGFVSLNAADGVVTNVMLDSGASGNG